ncbi:hypothetical protein HPB47_018090 [Ixodes persulcatus]|uniref:Uncharacterized protein n=1 Tax=Ixodes persulcatus TaxID=34615 RepID=A0AC60QLP4_IXOPE|nr:hypothetical protein HPB47_018090 [Ixodes persulcatus]
MAADASFTVFVDFVLRVDELLYDGRDDVPSHRCRDRLNPLEHFNDRKFLMRYSFRKTTVVSLLESLPLEASESDPGLPISLMLFYGAGTFQIVTGDLVNVSQPTVCQVVERVSRVLATSLFPRLVKFPEGHAAFDQRMLEFYEVRNRRHWVHRLHPRQNKGTWRSQSRGSVHDSRIFDNSRARVLYEHRRVPGLLLGNAGYACMSFLLTPLTSPGAANSPEDRIGHLRVVGVLHQSSCEAAKRRSRAPRKTAGGDNTNDEIDDYRRVNDRRCAIRCRWAKALGTAS